MDGSDTGAWAASSAGALADALPHPTRRTLDGQRHDVDWEVLAPVVRAFLAG
jgi:hypothetical protein